MIYPKMYNNFPYLLNKKTCKAIIIWLITLTIALISSIIIIFNYKYNNYKKYFGYIKNIDNSLLLTFYVQEEEINNIKDYQLLIDNQPFDFKMLSINNYLNGNNLLYEVVIETKLPDKYLIENNIIELVFKTKPTTLYAEIRKEFEI